MRCNIDSSISPFNRVVEGQRELDPVGDNDAVGANKKTIEPTSVLVEKEKNNHKHKAGELEDGSGRGGAHLAVVVQSK